MSRGLHTTSIGDHGLISGTTVLVGALAVADRKAPPLLG